jgi:hypothetical protein
VTTVIAQRVVLPVAFAVFGGGCALSRSHVKSLRDRDAGRIQLETVTHTTVAALNAIRSQCGPATDHRVRDEEFRVYDVVGRVARVKRERDHDIHIVLADPEDPRERLVVESDDPDFRGNAVSPYREKLAAARHMFDDLVKQSGARQLNDLRGTIVRVTGVGFFDMNHLQIGRSRSCIELHPILAIERVSERPSKRNVSRMTSRREQKRSDVFRTAHRLRAIAGTAAQDAGTPIAIPICQVADSRTDALANEFVRAYGRSQMGAS